MTTPAKTVTERQEERNAGEEPPSGGKIKVPSVVGKNHQLAQDTMQNAGLYALAEEDATGQSRLLVNDRNWKVVSQSPKPGTRVDDDKTITLRAKKVGE